MPDRVPHRTFGRRLAIAFALVAAFTAILSALLLVVVWNYQFDSYIRSNLQRDANAWATLLGDGYAANGNWSPQWVSSLPFLSPGREYVLEAVDAKGNTILRDEGAGHMRMMGGSTPAIEHAAIVSPIQVNGAIVGTVRVWSTGPGEMITQFDQQFRSAAFAGLLAAAVVALGFASVGGWFYAQRLTRPVARITETAEALRGGEADARTGLSGSDEIGFLGRTLDEMADAIEADRETERRLTADVAHELRTPLQAIQATVEAMQDGVLPADQERLGVVRDETVRLARLADAILELTKLERGTVPFVMTKLDFSDPVLAAIDTHRVLFETVGLTLSAEHIRKGLKVEGDADRLQQAVGNLLSNAARYTPEGGSVDVTLKQEGDCAVVRVTDTGIGIAEEDLSAVFQRFWRADSARDRSTGGLGIGLAVTREIVERHRGTISAQRGENHGSIFSISLPIAGAKPAKGAAPKA